MVPTTAAENSAADLLAARKACLPRSWGRLWKLQYVKAPKWRSHPRPVGQTLKLPGIGRKNWLRSRISSPPGRQATGAACNLVSNRTASFRSADVLFTNCGFIFVAVAFGLGKRDVSKMTRGLCYGAYVLYWCSLLVLNRQGLKGGSGPQRLIRALGEQTGHPIMVFHRPSFSPSVERAPHHTTTKNPFLGGGPSP
jgi:hypothetical protein